MYNNQEKLYLYIVTPHHRLKKLRVKICCRSALENLHTQLDPLCEIAELCNNNESPFHNEYIDTYYSFSAYIEEIVKTLNIWNLQYKKSKSEKERIVLRKLLNTERKNSLQPLVEYMINGMNKIKKKEMQYKKDYENAEKILRTENPICKEYITESFENLQVLTKELNHDILSELIKKYNISE